MPPWLVPMPCLLRVQFSPRLIPNTEPLLAISLVETAADRNLPPKALRFLRAATRPVASPDGVRQTQADNLLLVAEPAVFARSSSRIGLDYPVTNPSQTINATPHRVPSVGGGSVKLAGLGKIR